MDSCSRTEELLLQARTASNAERQLWERVRGKHPGTSEHDPKAWAEWLAAAQMVRRLDEQLRAKKD